MVIKWVKVMTRNSARKVPRHSVSSYIRQHRSASTTHDPDASSPKQPQQTDSSTGKESLLQRYEDAARNNRLDLITAAKLLFSTPEKPKKFGWDFHLWQFFVACLPPLAVYLCAQLIRADMRRMEKERELSEAARIEAEQKSLGIEQGQGENLAEPPDIFLNLKARLDALEEKISHLQAAADRVPKSISKEELLKSVREDQKTRSAVTESSKDGLSEKKATPSLLPMDANPSNIMQASQTPAK